MRNSNPLSLEELLHVPYVEPDLGFEISPDGSQAAFSWNKSGTWEIYTLDLNGDSQPRRKTFGEGSKFSPRWNPSGSKLAYVIDLDGGENYEIYVYDLESNTHSNITPNTPYALTSSFSWSPDGTKLAVCSDQAGRFDTYLMPSDGGAERKVLDQPHPDWEVTWSPDGSHLAVVSEGPGQDYWTFIVPIQDGESTPLSQDGDPICAKDARWSPAGSKLAFASNASGKFEIGIFEIETRDITWVTSGGGEKEFPCWIDESQLAYVLSEGPKRKLVVEDLREGEIFRGWVEPGVIYSLETSIMRDQITFVFENPRNPCDIWAFSLMEKTFHQVTHSLLADIEREKFVLPREIWYPGLDGEQVPALLYIPHSEVARSGEKPGVSPAVINVHGGPNWLTQITWDPLVQHMVSRGWTVLAPNYRGSTGYGKDWQLANRYDLGGVDTEDVVAGADYLVRENLADPAKISVTGRSWGGYLTMTCLTLHPDRWAAGSAVVPFLNWFTSHKNSREDLQHWDIENFGDSVTNRGLWYERSPFFFLDLIQSPVQLICGAHDVRCPASESTQAYEKLISLGKKVEYHLYPDEGHSFLKICNLVKSKKQQIDFLARYLE